MRRVVYFILALTLVLGSCSGGGKNTEANDSQASVTVDPAKVVTCTLKVEGMTCGGCENSVEKMLGKMEGVVSVKASYIDKTVVVEADTLMSGSQALKKGIADAGYTVIE
jgi:mercuric ion transport protein